MLVLGAWLLLSPFVLDYARAAAGNAHLVGAAIVVLAVVGLVRAPLWSGWAELVLGLWLMASAFALARAATPAYWNLLAVGASIVVLGLIAVVARAPGQRRPADG